MSHNEQTTHSDSELRKLMGPAAASSIGYDPNRTKPNERDLARARQRARDEYRTREALARAIEVRPARELMRRDPDEDPAPATAPITLLPPYWYPAQFAILTGPSDATLSLFGVQLAELIARSQVNSEQLTVNNECPSGSPSQTDPSLFTVHSSLFTYFDLARTRRQYREIYTHNGRRYRFAGNLNFGLLAGGPLPESYKGRREKFYRDAIGVKLGEADEPAVIIIDNISWLTRTGSPTEIRQLLRSFSSHVNQTGNSILLLAPNGARTPSSGSRRANSALHTPHSALLEFADTVFALLPSTFAPDHFYLKLLKSGSPPYQGGVDAASADGVVLSLTNQVSVYRLQRSASPPSLIHHSSLPTHHSSSSAFPGFEFLGIAPEEHHTRDYTAEILKFQNLIERAVEKEEKKRLRSAKESLAQGVVDGTYARYLLNE